MIDKDFNFVTLLPCKLNEKEVCTNNRVFQIIVSRVQFIYKSLSSVAFADEFYDVLYTILLFYK